MVWRLLEERKKQKEFKMGIILKVRDLDPRERSLTIDELVSREYEIPYSKKKTITRRTVYRWLDMLKNAPDPGKALLKNPRPDRGTFRKLTKEEQKALMGWRRRNPKHGADKLREELMENPALAKEQPASEQTITRFLRAKRLDRKTVLRQMEPQKAKKSTRLAFQARYPQAVWMGDTKGPDLRLVNPKSPEGVSPAKLVVFVDDNSRFCVGAQYFLEENAETVMALFKTAIATYGVPEILYVDRGAPYVANALKSAAALVGCRVMLTPPRDPESKGKAEKLMPQFTDGLESELNLLESPLIVDQANEYLAAFISQDYHQRVHSVTGEKPVDRYAAFPEQYRRFVSEDTLAMIFLPCVKAVVTKTSLIHLHKRQYLVPDPSLCRQRVDVRFDPLDSSKVLVFFQDKYRGAATLYEPVGDYLERQAALEKMRTPPPLELPTPPFQGWPAYTYLERKLGNFRREIEKNREINEELAELKARKEMVRATLTATPNAGKPCRYDVFGLAEFTHLLSMLLRRQLDPSERLKVATLWRHYGPLDESTVRQTVGRLLGEQVSEWDLSAYLDAIQVAACTLKPAEKEGGQKNDR